MRESEIKWFLYFLLAMGILALLLFSLFWFGLTPRQSEREAGVSSKPADWEKKLALSLDRLEAAGLSEAEIERLITGLEAEAVRAFLREVETTDLNRAGDIVKIADDHFNLQEIKLEKLETAINNRFNSIQLQVRLSQLDPDSPAVSFGLDMLQRKTRELLQARREENSYLEVLTSRGNQK